MSDPSNGYEAVADAFVSGRVRSNSIGVATVREWARTLPRGADVLDLGCGTGRPISQTLIEEGLVVYGIDASPTMIAAFRERFPSAPSECASAEDSHFFHRAFDGIIAWGLLFLLPPKTQTALIEKMAGALAPGGQLLFTAPRETATWLDGLTGRDSHSLGWDAYTQLLRDADLTLVGSAVDEGDNHYYIAAAPSQ